MCGNVSPCSGVGSKGCTLPGLRRPFRGVRRVMVVPCLRRPASRSRRPWRPPAFSTNFGTMGVPLVAKDTQLLSTTVNTINLAQGCFQEYSSDALRILEQVGDLIFANWHDIENNVASEVHVRRFESKEIGIKKLQEAFLFPCADGSQEREGHTQRRTLRHQRVDSFDAERVPPFTP